MLIGRVSLNYYDNGQKVYKYFGECSNIIILPSVLTFTYEGKIYSFSQSLISSFTVDY